LRDLGHAAGRFASGPRKLFEAAAEATYEAVLNSLCVADAMSGRDGRHAEAFPYELLPRLRGL
jgi:L-aminopeptidase/D-esterase-like protein